MPFIVEETGELGWIEEAKAKPSDARLWQRARTIAHMDKQYNPMTARILTRKIYQMLGGAYAPIKKKGKTAKIEAPKSKSKKRKR